ncbi:MAG: hypothetical protein PVJ53_17490 [Desulfobacterales bacterium]|jgi:glutamate/tyrosine decarboxylase-like PLP-dependent enzyme
MTPAPIRARMRRELEGQYIQHRGGREGMPYGPDMSPRVQAVALWAARKFLGQNGFEELIDGSCDLASRFAERLQAQGLPVSNEAVFN